MTTLRSRMAVLAQLLASPDLARVHAVGNHYTTERWVREHREEIRFWLSAPGAKPTTLADLLDLNRYLFRQACYATGLGA